MMTRWFHFFILATASVLTSSAFAADADVKATIQAACPSYTFAAKEASLARLNPPATTKDGVTLPGTSQVLFRGAQEKNPQFSFEHVLLGLLGQDNWQIGSPMHWGITEVLTGNWSLTDTFIPSGGLPLTMSDYFEVRGILNDVKTLLKCKDSFYSKAQADLLGRDLMNKIFNSMTSAEIGDKYLNFTADDYYSASVGNYGLGNNAVDFIISSYSDQIASLYGKKVLVFKDKKNRSVDLGYWNFAKHGTFWSDWPDNGEINTPGYITSADLLGFQLRENERGGANWASYTPNNPIDIAIYKLKFKNTDIVIVVDGEDETCMLQDSKTQMLYYCKDNWSGQIMQKNIPAPVARGTDQKNKAPLIGAIVKCNTESSCSLPDGFFEWYGKSSTNTLSDALTSSVDSLKVNGKTLKYFQAKTLAAPVSVPPVADAKATTTGTIKVISATYADAAQVLQGLKGNVTAAAAKFADGKTQVVYKVSSRFLGISDATVSRKFEIEYICSQKPTSILKKTVDAPAENKNFLMNCSGD